MLALRYQPSDVGFYQIDEKEGVAYKQSDNSCYVYDPNYDVLCIVGFGEHLIGILYLLKTYYGFTFENDENIKEYQNILNTFELNSAWKLPIEYAEEAKADGAWLCPIPID